MLERAARAGVTRQIVTGADLASSLAASAMAAASHSTVGAADAAATPRLWSTAGVHPHHASGFDTTTCAELRELLRLPHVVAVGECGLDYNRNFSSPAAQRNAFVAQLGLAVATAKPVFLHQRDSHDDFKSILADFRGQVRGVAHCFTGDRTQLQDYVDLGLWIGITGWVCDERRGGSLREAVRAIPAERLMLETDAPYLLPRDLQPRPKSRRNEPAFLRHVAQTVADLRDEALTTLAATTTYNAIQFFGIS